MPNRIVRNFLKLKMKTVKMAVLRLKIEDFSTKTSWSLIKK